MEECSSRIRKILEDENISVDDEEVNKLDDLIKNNYPDLRRTINEVQKYTNNGKLFIADTLRNEKFASAIFELIQKGAVLKLRKYIIQNEEKFNSDYPMLLKNLFDYVDGAKISEQKKRMCLVVIAEALYRSAFVADQEINCYSCMIQLSESI